MSMQAVEMEQEVVVVGAGPGGVVMAYLLARSGVKVALLERHVQLDREFRGYFFQPLVVKLLDEMGLLQGLLEKEHYKTGSFRFIDRKKELFSVNFFELKPPYDYGLLMHQPLFLQYMIDQASKFDTFTYLSGTRAAELLTENGAVAGIKALKGKEELFLRSKLVVGADGRYSTIRKLAGIEMEQESHTLDFLWFDLPGQPEGQTGNIQIQIEEEGMLIYTPKGAEVTQVGWVIPKGTYAEIRSKGLEAFKKQVAAVDPKIGPLLEHLQDFKQVSVLDIQVAMAKQWVRNGLMLIGDAAHIASPFSGQGNSLAIQDAVVAHGVLMRALRDAKGPIPADMMAEFERTRRGPVEKIKKIQRMQAKMISIRHPLFVRFRRTMLPIVRRTPLFKKMRDTIAMGAAPVRVHEEYRKAK
ncbi:FAD-dependent oxidoreductase [Paenibacillus sp.]|uniref:FAD-dependent oxidoreductase n=1 Tax=Paenibacillus sp. TaxID=58172 RepID=UPI002D52CC6F|nr:FAD-dependent oxidoreductase [Paenibacillus sp.]HZG85445.1 FAD-dependent oxidoreductase [Paenibacillus sp.]